MWYVSVGNPKHRPAVGSSVVLPGGVVAWWCRVELAEVRRMAAHFRDDERLARTLRTIPHRIVVSDSEVKVIEAAPEVVAAATQQIATAAALVSGVRAMALANGWTASDLAGSGVGDPGEAGGRSPVTGLYLAEAALVSPPTDWPELRERGRPPWESAAWRSPSPLWGPPAWKGLPPIAARPEDPLVPNPFAETDDVANDAASSPTPAPAAAPADAPPERVESVESPLYDYPPAQLPKMVEIIRGIYDARGSAPHPNSANYHLKKAGIPNVTSAQIAAVVALPR